jgi:hypothetical protein
MARGVEIVRHARCFYKFQITGHTCRTLNPPYQLIHRSLNGLLLYDLAVSRRQHAGRLQPTDSHSTEGQHGFVDPATRDNATHEDVRVHEEAEPLGTAQFYYAIVIR